jgi:hypothetical protein
MMFYNRKLGDNENMLFTVHARCNARIINIFISVHITKKLSVHGDTLIHIKNVIIKIHDKIFKSNL